MLGNIEKLFPPILGSHDGTPHFLLGNDACVGSLRKLQGEESEKKEHAEGDLLMANNTTQPSTNYQGEGEQQGEAAEEEEERLLCYLKSTDVTVNLPHYKKSFSNIRGKIFVTTKRLFFVTHDDEAASFDFSMNAYCISLHALMSEPTHSVYCQLVNDDGGVQEETTNDEEFDTASASEVVIQPVLDGADQDKGQSLCQTLFNALTKLINLNPILDDDGEEDGGIMGLLAGSGGLATMYGAGLVAGGDEGSTQEYDDYDDDVYDDIVYRVDSKQISVAQDMHTIMTEEESEHRARMLRHLDSLLVVPPEYENIMEGQFEDANEDETSDEDIL